MNLYINKDAAHHAATEKQIAAAKLGASPRHSSGHSRIKYGVKRRFRIFWTVTSS